MATTKRAALLDGNGMVCTMHFRHSPGERMPQLFDSLVEKLADGYDMVFVAWDSKASFRKRLYPQYKANRPPKPEALVQSLKECRLTCGFSLPVNTESMVTPGLEGDDLIADKVRELSDYQCFIVSNDKDYRQLLERGRVQMLGFPHYESGSQDWAFPSDQYPFQFPRKNQTFDSHMEEFGIHPKAWPLYQAMAGDGCDGWPGIKGIGAKKAQAIIHAMLGDGNADITDWVQVTQSVAANWKAISESIPRRLWDAFGNFDFNLGLRITTLGTPYGFNKNEYLGTIEHGSASSGSERYW